MTDPRRLLLALALIALCGGAAESESARTIVCTRDLLVTDSALRATRARLDDAAKGGEADQCTAWHRHGEVMRAARKVFDRCAGERERAEKVGAMDASIEDFERIVRERCAGPAAPVMRPRP